MLPMFEIAGMQDREGIWCVVGRRNEPIAVIGPENRGIPVADEDPRMDVFSEERTPRNGRYRMSDRRGKHMRQTRAEIAREVPIKSDEVLLRVAGNEVGLRRTSRALNGNTEALALGRGVDGEIRRLAGLGGDVGHHG